MAWCLGLVWVLMFALGVWAHDLGPVDVLISPNGGFIETETCMIRSDFIPAWRVAQDLRHFRPDLWPGLDYVALSLAEKATGQVKTVLIPLDEGILPYFTALEEREYCGKPVLFVSVRRETPRYGGIFGLWSTTYLFRADRLELRAKIDGAATDVTLEDAGYVPEVPFSIMPERFLVFCVSQGRERQFSLGLIDRRALYGPDWCGPQARRCEMPP
jgi:hypothetical protein